MLFRSQLTDDGKLKGLRITISEQGVLATADLHQLIEHAESTDEVRGMVQITLGELFERGEKATESVDAWNSYSSGKPRNDSVFYLAGAFLKDWQSKLS